MPLSLSPRPQLHHIIRNCPEAVNQRDGRGLTALHRAAFLAQYEGYMEIYEYLLVRARGLHARDAAPGAPDGLPRAPSKIQCVDC